MRPSWLCLAVFLLTTTALLAQAPSALRVTGDYRGMPLAEVLAQLEAEHELGFNFLRETVAGKTVDCQFRNAAWDEVAACLFTANGLEARLLPRGYVSLRPVVAPDTLELSVVDLETVFVAEYVTDGITASPDGREVRIRPEKSPPVPGVADGELTRMLALLPGISSLQESAGDLSIRGGARDQNLVLWDGIPVYSTGHYFGMISNFSPELVDKIDVWRGQAEAAYGGRVAGVIRLETDRQITKKLEAGFGSSLLQTDGYAKIPLLAGKSDLHLSAKGTLPPMVQGPTYQSYREQLFQADEFERLLTTEDTPAPATEDFGFHEFNGRWQYDLRPGRRVILSGFAQRDDFSYAIGSEARSRFYKDRLRSENNGIGLRYDHQGRAGRAWSVQATLTDFANSGTAAYRDGRTKTLDVRETGIREASLRWGYGLPLGPAGRLETGAQAQFWRNSFGARRDNELTNTRRELLRNGEAKATAFFASYRWEPRGPWRAEAGLRLPYYFPTGRLYVEPRLNGSYQLTDVWLLKAAYGANHQFAQELLSRSPTFVAASAPIWSLAGVEERFPVQAGQEVSFGVVGKPRGWLLDLEVYRKGVTGLSALTLGAQEGGVAVGEQRATGLDLLIKHRRGNWRGWAIYSLSQTEWRFPNTRVFPKGFFPADNDRRHQLRLLNTYAAGPWSFSLAWRVQSGARFTEITEVGRQRNERTGIFEPLLQRGEINDTTLAVYHRLDLSAFYEWGQKGAFRGRVGLALINVYDQQNVLEREYLIRRKEQPEIRARQFESVPLERTGLGFG